MCTCLIDRIWCGHYKKDVLPYHSPIIVVIHYDVLLDKELNIEIISL